MPRDAHIPLFLWLALALLVHLLGGDGVARVSQWMGERIELRHFAEDVRSYVKASNTTVELALQDEATPPEPEPEPEAAPKPETDEQVKPTKDEDAQLEPEKKLEPKDKEKPKPEPEKKPEPVEKKKPEEEPKKEEVPAKPVAAQELVNKKAISVRQHVEDEKQPENKDAEFLAEHNNKVSEQSQARITSNDQDDAKPTPGASPSSAGEQPGDSNQTKIAQSEDRPGEEARAPSDDPAPLRPKTSDVQPNSGAPAAVAKAHTAPAQPGVTTGSEKASQGPTAAAASPGSRGQAEQREQLAAPDLLNSPNGSTAAAQAQAAQAEQKAQQARARRELPRRKIRGYEDMLGLGASGTTASGVNLNLTPGLARDAIGMDQLSRERLADGARRRSQHLGSWKAAGIERWRSAIENYVPSVKPGNQTALNTARAPFAAYLALIHNRLHPIFADWYLASLDSLPASDPINNPELSTNLEIILDPEEGRIVKMGVTKHSGITRFDVAALDSVSRAAPFGTPPHEIVSPDGKVYLHWEFHRFPGIACTTQNARPFILRAQPTTAPPGIPPAEPVPDDSNRERHGARDVPRRYGLASSE
jgi:hypothetical protein